MNQGVTEDYFKWINEKKKKKNSKVKSLLINHTETLV